jgi:hypothetical protein
MVVDPETADVVLSEPSAFLVDVTRRQLPAPAEIKTPKLLEASDKALKEAEAAEQGHRTLPSGQTFVLREEETFKLLQASDAALKEAGRVHKG